MTSVIYKKAFALSSKARQKYTIGEIVNHQAIDAKRIQDLLPYVQTFWSSPFQIIGILRIFREISFKLNFLVALIQLYQTLGYAMLGGVSVMVLMIPLNFAMAR